MRGLNAVFMAGICCLAVSTGAHAENMTDCMATMPASPPESLPYMPSLRLKEPMPTEMKKDGMMKSDVAMMASKKEKCLSQMMDQEKQKANPQ